MNLFNTRRLVFFEAPVDKGADPTPATEKIESVKSNNDDIKDISKSITNPEGKTEKGPVSRHIGYFSEDDDDAIDTDPADPPAKAVAEPPVEDDPVPDNKEEGDDPDTVDPPDPDKSDKFYVPERDAKGRDTYPNEFETKIDAQFAITEKVDTYDKMVAELKENNSGLGAVIDPEIAEKIEAYRDLEYPNSVDDDQLRLDIADIDEGLKAVKSKNERVKSRFEKTQRTDKLEGDYKKAEEVATKSSKELGIPERLKDLPENPEKEDLMGLVDEQIQAQLSTIDQELQSHREDESFLEDKGLAEYNNKLSELQTKRSDLVNNMSEHRSNLDTWWDAQEEYRSASSKKKELTPQQKSKNIDAAFLEFQEDRSEGPNALDIFTKSKDTTPIVHFRQYALKNSEQFDLSDPKGWIKAHSSWKSWIQQSVSGKKTAAQKKAAEKKRPPIKAPGGSDKRSQVIPSGDSFDKLQETNDDIGKLSRSIMNRK